MFPGATLCCGGDPIQQQRPTRTGYTGQGEEGKGSGANPTESRGQRSERGVAEERTAGLGKEDWEQYNKVM